jgi:hypothetical protein
MAVFFTCVACQPTIAREKQLITNATWTNPDEVRQYVKSVTHFRLGAAVVKSRSSRSGARLLPWSVGTVVR